MKKTYNAPAVRIEHMAPVAMMALSSTLHNNEPVDDDLENNFVAEDLDLWLSE